MVIRQAKEVLKIEAQGILSLVDRVGPEFEKTIETIMKAKGRVILAGMGKSGLIARKIAATLNSTGTPSQFLHPAEAIHGDLGMVTSDDVVVAISNSGQTTEINNILPMLKKIGAKIIGFTGGMDSPMAEACDLVIDVGVEREACPMGMAPTASTTAALAMGDALAVVLINRRHFNQDDFKRFHPGGSLGERLAVKVREIMLTNDRIPMVPLGSKIQQVIEEIDAKKVGAISMTSIEETKALAPWTEDLPPDWQVTRLDNVANVFFSNVDKHTKEGEVPVRLCNYVDVYKNERITSGLDFMEASAELREIKKFQIQRGDVLATKDSEAADDIAIPALVAEDLPKVLCGYHLALIRPRFSTFSGPFLAWLHSSKSFRAQYEAKAVGVTRFGLSQYAFRAARIPLPSLPEQQRIAAYLDASCTAIDAAVAAKRKQIETLDALHKTIIHNVITKGLNAEFDESRVGWIEKTPRNWKKVKMFRICQKISSGGTPSTSNLDYYGGNIPWVQTGDLNDGYVEVIEKTITRLGLEKSAARIYPEGTLLIAMYGATIGKLGILKNPSATNQACCAMKFRNDVDNRFIFYLLRDLRPTFIAMSYGGGQPNISQETIKQLYFFLPPFHEQQKISQYLDNRTSAIETIKASIESQIATLTAYRKSLIHECVTGQRRITEADVAQARGGEK